MDAATATAIVGVAGVIGTAVSGAFAYRAGVHSAREETNRLHRQHREEERRNRQGTYHRMIELINRVLDQDEWDAEDWRSFYDDWYFVMAGISLFGHGSVSAQMEPLTKVLNAAPDIDAASSAWEEWRSEVVDASKPLVDAMRRDIGASDWGAAAVEPTGGGSRPGGSRTTADA